MPLPTEDTMPLAIDAMRHWMDSQKRDSMLLERALGILHRMATERAGWRRFISRWYYSDEPLRNDAANLVREAGFGMMQPINTRLVGDLTNRPTMSTPRLHPNEAAMLTERQRTEAIAACDRIIAANNRLQAIAADIKRSADELRARWPQNPNRMPRDGDSVEGDLTGSV